MRSPKIPSESPGFESSIGFLDVSNREGSFTVKISSEQLQIVPAALEGICRLRVEVAEQLQRSIGLRNALLGGQPSEGVAQPAHRHRVQLRARASSSEVDRRCTVCLAPALVSHEDALKIDPELLRKAMRERFDGRKKWVAKSGTGRVSRAVAITWGESPETATRQPHSFAGPPP